jgi:hypothetical protein
MARCIDDVGVCPQKQPILPTTVPTHFPFLALRYVDIAGAAVRIATGATARLLVTNCGQNGRFNGVDPKYGISSRSYVRPLITVWAGGMV